MCDENQTIDNRIIPLYMTGALKHSKHMTEGIQNIPYLPQKIESYIQRQ